MKIIKPTGGWKANAFMIFDYFGPTDFKFGGIDASTNKLVLGHRNAVGWWYDAQSTPKTLKDSVYYNLLIAVNGTAATITIDGTSPMSFTYVPRLIDGVASPLNHGWTGMGSNNSRGAFDNVVVQVTTPVPTYDKTTTLSAGVGPLTLRYAGTWTVGAGGLNATPAASGVALVGADIGASISSTAWVEFTGTVLAPASGWFGLAFDVYTAGDAKFALLDIAGKRAVFAHLDPLRGFAVDAAVAWAGHTPGLSYTLQIVLKGASASLTVNGGFALSFGYNSSTVDGWLGLSTRGVTATFGTIRIRANDPGLAAVAAALTVSAPAPRTAPTITARYAAPSPQALAAALDAARAHWLAAGAQPSALEQVQVHLAELPGLRVARADGRLVTVDPDAAGWGWATGAPSAGSSGLDLVRVLAHEIGHVLGLGHEPDGLMAATVDPTGATVGIARPGADGTDLVLVTVTSATSDSAPQPATAAVPTDLVGMGVSIAWLGDLPSLTGVAGGSAAGQTWMSLLPILAAESVAVLL